MSTSEAQATPGPALVDVAWRVSTRSPNGDPKTCVEAGPLGDGTGRVAVRHSRDRGGATFVYSRAEWDAFLTGIKHGGFDFTT